MVQSITAVRRSERQEISLPADCQTSWGKIKKVILSDISAEGCRIATLNDLLQAGNHVIIRTSSLLGGTGTVRWVKGGSVGIEFDHPLSGSVLDYFLRNQAAGATIIVPCERELELRAS